jgi:hypothetical protein
MHVGGQFGLYLRILGKICTWIVIVLEMDVIYSINKCLERVEGLMRS